MLKACPCLRQRFDSDAKRNTRRATMWHSQVVH